MAAALTLEQARDRLMRSSLAGAAKRLLARVSDDDLSGLAAELAYRGLLAVFPFFILAAAVGGYTTKLLGIDDPTTRIIDRIGDSLPEDAASILEGQLRGVLEAQEPGLLSFGLIFTVFAGSAAMNTIIKALNRIYKVEEQRPFVQKTTVCVGLTLLAGASLVVAFTLLFVGQVFGEDIADALGLGGVYGTLVTLARWPVILAIVVVAVTVLYRFAPAKRMALPWTSAGALAFTVMWALATLLFGLYISNFGSYQVSYGTLAGVVILMIWFYLSSFMLLLGAELNQLLSEETDAPVEISRSDGGTEKRRERGPSPTER